MRYFAFIASVLSIPLIVIGCQHQRGMTYSYRCPECGQMHQASSSIAPVHPHGKSNAAPAAQHAAVSQGPAASQGLSQIPPIPAVEDDIEPAGHQVTNGQ